VSVERADVVVVGAGLAGLRAAGDLLDEGARVVVLEARDRVGGRVHSHRFEDGQWCERGAEFVDGHHTEVLALVEALGLQLSVNAPDADLRRRLLDVGGRLVCFADLPGVMAEHERWNDACAALAVGIEPDDPTGAPHAASLDSRHVGELIDSLDLSVLARVLIGREVRTEFMVAPNELSQLHLAWMTAITGRAGARREAYRLVGGLDQLAVGLANRCGPAVRLGSPVASVDAEQGAVTTERGEVFVAEHIVLAVPAPVLARLDISPSLPSDIHAIGCGIGGKVHLRYERRVWRDAGFDGSVLSDRAWGELWDTTGNQPGDHGVLTALLSSHDGAALAAMPDTADRIRKEVVRCFPDARGMTSTTLVTDWTNDAWSLGCYAAFAPGQLTRTWADLRRPHGRVRLAGEHTDGFAGFMEGALRSGARVAHAITSAR
jgi:monoamine oxidase